MDGDKANETNERLDRIERELRNRVIPLLKGLQSQNWKTQDMLKKIDLRVK